MKKFLICITVVLMCIGTFFAVACSSFGKNDKPSGSQEEITSPSDSDSGEKSDGGSDSGNSGETGSDSGNSGESSPKDDTDFGDRGENELPRVPLN